MTITHWPNSSTTVPSGFAAVVPHGLVREMLAYAAERMMDLEIEQDRPYVLRQRQHWLDGQIDLEPERLVFIDATWTATKMIRSHGRCPKGERLRMGFPHGHCKTTTLVAGHAHDWHGRADGAGRVDQ